MKNSLPWFRHGVDVGMTMTMIVLLSCATDKEQTATIGIADSDTGSKTDSVDSSTIEGDSNILNDSDSDTDSDILNGFDWPFGAVALHNPEALVGIWGRAGESYQFNADGSCTWSITYESGTSDMFVDTDPCHWRFKDGQLTTYWNDFPNGFSITCSAVLLDNQLIEAGALIRVSGGIDDHNGAFESFCEYTNYRSTDGEIESEAQRESVHLSVDDNNYTIEEKIENWTVSQGTMETGPTQIDEENGAATLTNSLLYVTPKNGTPYCLGRFENTELFLWTESESVDISEFGFHKTQ